MEMKTSPKVQHHKLTFCVSSLTTAASYNTSIELVDVLKEYRPLMTTTDPQSDSIAMEEFRPDSPAMTIARRRLFCGSRGQE